MAYQTISPSTYYTKNGKNFTLEYDSRTGNVQLYETGLTAIGTTPIFFNGTFRQDFLDGLGVTNQERDELYLKIQNNINSAFNSAGGTAKNNILPSFAQTSQVGTAPGTTINPIPGAPVSGGGVGAAVSSILSPGLDLNIDFSSANASKVYGGTTVYPKDLLKDRQDTLQITQFEYQPPKGEIFSGSVNVSDILTKGIQRGTALKKQIGIVILPIPSGVQDSNNTDWGGDQMSSLSAAATGQVLNTMALSAVGAGANALGQSFGVPNMAPAAMAGILYTQAASSPEVQSLIKTAAASQILKQAGFEVSPESILARSEGIVPNSNLELLFNGPTLRQFTFAYRMSPRSELEAKDIKKIIRFFKQGMAAKKQNSKTGSGASSLFLGTPNVFKLQYKTGNEEISALNKFKICALTGFSVNYAPDGQWAAYEKGQPVSLTINMSFQELEPVYESDYNDTGVLINSGDNPKVGPEDVGY